MTLSRRNIVIIAVTLALLALVYFAFDPTEARWMPKCMLHTITGWDCPGCGSQRAAHALLHGDIPGAFRQNALLMIMLPYLALLLAAELFKTRLQGLFKALYSTTAIIIVVCVIVAWGVVRNLM